MIKIMNKKRIIIASVSVVAAFALCAAAWGAWRHVKYSPYLSPGMEPLPHSPSNHVYTAEDSYSYGVKFPGFLSLTGNLHFSAPMELGYGMIIWPRVFGGYRFGMILVEQDPNDETHFFAHQIYVDEHGNAIDPADQSIIDRNRDQADHILARVNARWGVLG